MRSPNYILSMIVCAALMVMTPGGPVHAQTAQQQLEATIAQMEAHAAKGEKESFEALRRSLEQQDTPEAYVALGQLFSSLPTEYVLRTSDYGTAAAYYEKALSRAQELRQETSAVNQARISLARLILMNRLPSHDYARATELLKKAIEAGNSSAAYILARRMEQGIDGKAPAYDQAEYWYRYALRGQVGEAAIALASLYQRGHITPPNENSVKEMAALGITLLRQRADKNDPGAAYRLGRIYALGIGVPVDREEARKWYERSAKAGSPNAYRELAIMASRDEGDRRKATQYMIQAAEHGSINAASALGQRLLQRDDYYLDLSEQEAQLWMERAAALGNVASMNILIDQLLNQGKIIEAVSYLERAAEKGSIESYLTLYQLFKNGQGVQKDEGRARTYFMAAAAHPDLSASEEKTLGMLMLQKAEPVYDVERGLAMVRESAESGNIEAMTFLAQAYRDGRYGEADLKQSLQWWQKAADAGDVGATLELSAIYEEGKLVKQDRKKANILLNETLRNVRPDDATAMLTIGKAYVDGKIVAQDMDEAARWFNRAIKLGSVEAFVALGRLVKWNAVKGYEPEQSVALFQQAARVGSPSALVELGMLYSMGSLVPQEPTMALEFFRLAADNGSFEGMRQVGLAYMAGLGVDKDEETGLRYLRQAAGYGHEMAMLDLGNAYAFRGDSGEAVRWWKQAAANNVADAHYMLALAYRNGDGVPRDAAMADRYLKSAAMLDNYAARTDLTDSGTTY